MAGLKTAFPLLALSMETMTDQLSKHFKCPPDEDAHRLIVALLNDGLHYISRAPMTYAEGAKLPPQTEANVARFVQSVLPAHIRKSFEADFVQTKPTMYEYIHKLRKWRDKFEQKLDNRQQWAPLESYSHHLSEFKFLKFDDSVEVPGQYQQHKDKNTDFVRIERFMPTVELVRGNSICHRRLTIRGHDGSLHPFAVQHPTGGKVRREERIVQLFRIFNQTLAKRKESRRRNLYFHLPIFVPIAPHIRLVQDDASYITLQSVYEDHVRKLPTNTMSRDDPLLFVLEKSRTIAEQQKTTPRTPEQVAIMKTEIFSTIQERWVPNTIALKYFQSIYPSFEDFWLFRRQFSYQFAATTFMTYVMHMSARYPMKFSVSRSTGDIWASDLLPNLNSSRALFYNPEQVPFRLSPNLQTLMGPLGVEGIFTASLMAIARCLTTADGGDGAAGSGYEMEQQLAVFVRDEMFNWAAGRPQNAQGGEQKMEGNHLRELVAMNVDFITRRALTLAKTQGNLGAAGGATTGASTANGTGVSGEGSSSGSGGGAGNNAAAAAGGVTGVLPACQNVVDLVSKATDPTRLSSMDGLWMPWF
jgi:transformation/transcription domain-associated protein